MHPECEAGYLRLVPPPNQEHHGGRPGPPPAYVRNWRLAMQAGQAKRRWLAKRPCPHPRRLSTLSAAWLEELAQHGTSEPTYDQVSVGLYEMRVTSDISNQLLEAIGPDYGPVSDVPYGVKALLEPYRVWSV